MYWHAVLGISCLKLILWPCYFSTDFEVHRNWLAITHSLPLKEWYTEDTSEWTLDYPPFFAWFEWFLSQFARFVDPQMLKVDNLNYRSFQTIIFQRVSVIVCDLVLAVGLKICVDAMAVNSSNRRASTGQTAVYWPLLILTNAGLILVDHVHFQYNGFLFGFLLASIGTMMSGHCLWSAALFVILLNLKHIFLYCAPAYFVYLFTSYCFVGPSTKSDYYSWSNFSPKNLIKLGLIVITGFAISFGPFVVQGQIFNVLGRLFPFKRGLTHAYWAPNFWALYNGLDLVGSRLVSTFLDPNFAPASSLTGGLVQETEHALLPTITPLTTFVLTALAMIPALIQLLRLPKEPLHFVRALILCSFASFLFGWHVHEKAILLVTIPLALISTASSSEGKSYFILSTVGTFSLFPLIFTEPETSLKLGLLICQILITLFCFQRQKKRGNDWRLNWFEKLYLLGLILVFFTEHLLALVGLEQRFKFLPLLFYSTYCSVAIIQAFFSLYGQLFKG